MRAANAVFALSIHCEYSMRMRPSSSFDGGLDHPWRIVEFEVGDPMNGLRSALYGVVAAFFALPGSGQAAEPACPLGNHNGRIAEMLEFVFFDWNSAAIDAETAVMLDNVVKVSSEIPQCPIRLGGHAGTSGPASYNAALSRRRAEAVVVWLRRHGVRAEIHMTWWGETQPLVKRAITCGNRRIGAYTSQWIGTARRRVESPSWKLRRLRCPAEQGRRARRSKEQTSTVHLRGGSAGRGGRLAALVRKRAGPCGRCAPVKRRRRWLPRRQWPRSIHDRRPRRAQSSARRHSTGTVPPPARRPLMSASSALPLACATRISGQSMSLRRALMRLT